jgi:hypothetical protein
VGLLNLERAAETPEFEIKPFHMGYRPGLNHDSVAALLEYAEGENYR